MPKHVMLQNKIERKSKLIVAKKEVWENKQTNMNIEAKVSTDTLLIVHWLIDQY